MWSASYVHRIDENETVARSESVKLLCNMCKKQFILISKKKIPRENHDLTSPTFLSWYSDYVVHSFSCCEKRHRHLDYCRVLRFCSTEGHFPVFWLIYCLYVTILLMIWIQLLFLLFSGSIFRTLYRSLFYINLSKYIPT